MKKCTYCIDTKLDVVICSARRKLSGTNSENAKYAPIMYLVAEPNITPLTRDPQ